MVEVRKVAFCKKYKYFKFQIHHMYSSIYFFFALNFSISKLAFNNMIIVTNFFKNN